MLIKSYGKINPILKIGNKREDGFHNLFLLYQTVSLYDILQIKVESASTKEIKITCNDDTIPVDERNLAYIAAFNLLSEFDLNFKVLIDIEKHIPHGGGLGGGSSNAASVIVCLNKLLNLNLTKSKMMNLASKIGSDVPFFIEGGTAAGVSRGEIIIPMKPLPKLNFLAVFPNIPFPTGKMYSLAGEVQGLCSNNYYTQIVDLYENPVKYFENDFNLIVGKMSKEVAQIMEAVRKQGYKVMLSGSGSTFLVFKEGNEDFENAINLLPASYKYKLASTDVSKS